MKLAVKKELGAVPGGGFHYMLHPMPMENDFQCNVFERLGHLIIEVSENEGRHLISEACASINHQMQVALITEKQAAQKLKGDRK